MDSRRLLLISVGLNLALLLVGLRLLNREAALPAPAASASPSNKAGSPSRVDPRAGSVAPRTERAGFSWRMIESEDLRVYAANLRQVGCPEQTIRDILLPLLEEFVDARKTAAVSAETVGPFWTSRTEMDGRRAMRTQSRRQLAQESANLSKALFGVYLDNEAVREWHRDFEVGLFFGWLPEGKPELLLSLLKYHFEQGKALRLDARDVLLAQDLAALQALVQQVRQEAAQFLSPGEFEEGELRLMAALFGFNFFKRMAGMTVNAQEIRSLLSDLRPLGDKLFAEAIGGSFGHEEFEELYLPEFEAEVVRALEGERAALFQRLREPEFRRLLGLVREEQISDGVAVAAFEVMKATTAELKQIEKTPGLTSEERESQLDQAWRIAEADLRSLLGDAAFAKLKVGKRPRPPR